MNPFEQLPVLGKPKKQDICEHGNPKDLCEVCGKETRSEDSEEIHTFSAPKKEEDERQGNREGELAIVADRARGFQYPESKEDRNLILEGWLTNRALAKKLKLPQKTIRRQAEELRLEHPEWFRSYHADAGKREYYFPELIQEIERLLKEASPPEGWMVNGTLARNLGVDSTTTRGILEKYRITNPEWFWLEDGKEREYYSPELVEKVSEEILSRKIAPDGWATNGMLADQLDVADATIQGVADKYKATNPEWFVYYLTKSRNKFPIHYSPELVEKVSEEILSRKIAPDGWATNKGLARLLNTRQETIEKIANEYRTSYPEWFKKLKHRKTGVEREHYSPELVSIVAEEFSPQKNAPLGWSTASSLARDLKVDKTTIERIAEEYKDSNPEWFSEYRHPKGVNRKYYSPELVSIITETVKKREDRPEGWYTTADLADLFGVRDYVIKSIANGYRSSHPEWFKDYKNKAKVVQEHYSYELIEIIKDDLEKRKHNKSLEEEHLKQSLEDFFREISDPETADERARKIRTIMDLLPENACDILLRYHPEYSGLKNEYVKSVIADYLGDFLLVRKTWEPKDIEMVGELFSEERFAEALFIKFKEASFAYYQKEKKNAPEGDDHDLMMGYFAQTELVRAAARIPEVQQTFERLKGYYEDLFRWADKKPDNVVDSLKEGRVFPDINQLINIKEIVDNGKMLIADEMGLGKSASVILAKECLGLKCAVIVIPSNVEDTWKTYLSDTVDEKGKQRGYFKKDASPRVLTIESKADLERLKGEHFDYILISQEKISKEHYVEALEGVDFDMLIMDEVHKLKNIEEGIRSENAVRLAEKIQGKDRYLAMLSGTPMPNKIKDLAIILKLLYPEKYKDTDDKVLVERIIYGDMADLRQELFSRMQMKGVETSIEIPPLVEEPDVEIELTDEEKEVYQILLEEDELTASEKIIVFRKFLLNPELLGMEPGFEGSKIRVLRETLTEDLKTKKRIIVWVNSYIDGVIRPELDEKGSVVTEDIIGKLGLPENTAWVIHGEDRKKKQYRQEVQKLFNDDGPEKMVLFVSGGAADVGVDFSGADAMIHYNEPWSKYDKKQQEGRAHREGQRARQTVKTLIAKGTIEEGMRRYTNAKERAIEKLLRGLERTEAENEMLRKDAVSGKKDVESDKDLSRDYTSDWERLMLHFGQGWQAGEEWFRHMPDEEKESYARLYWGAKRLSYQGNNARVSATLLEKVIADQERSGDRLRILDIASGPEMLKRCAREDLRDQIYSMDINGKHFETALDERRTFERSFLNLPVRSESVDYYNMGFAFHQTKPVKFYKKNYERLHVLAEMSRVLKIGGLAIISEIHNVEFENPEALKEVLMKLGMRIVEEYSGKADGGENYKAHFLTLEKIAEIDGYGKEVFWLNEIEKKQKVRELGDKLGKELVAGLKIKKLPKGASRLEDQRRMINNFRLGGKEFRIHFTDEDRKLFDEEKKSIEDGEALKKRFGGRVDSIPLPEIHEIGFKRKLRNPNLMYKIVENGGVIVVRGDRV